MSNLSKTELSLKIKQLEDELQPLIKQEWQNDESTGNIHPIIKIRQEKERKLAKLHKQYEEVTKNQ